MIRVPNADSNVSILICALILKILRNNTMGTKKSFTDFNFVRFELITANSAKFYLHSLVFLGNLILRFIPQFAKLISANLCENIIP